jgi:hypothetical protein
VAWPPERAGYRIGGVERAGSAGDPEESDAGEVAAAQEDLEQEQGAEVGIDGEVVETVGSGGGQGLALAVHFEERDQAVLVSISRTLRPTPKALPMPMQNVNELLHS